MSNPQFLRQQQPRLSQKEAEKILDSIFRKLDLKIAEKHKRSQTIFTNQGTENEKHFRYIDLTNQIRKFGTCEIQSDLDKLDPIFGGTFGMSSPNWQFDITSSWAGYQKTLKGPFRNIPTEHDLADDIEFYKDETCNESSEYDFEMVARNYRGFLFSSIALIDSYINRHIIYFEYSGLSNPLFLKLKASRNTDERIELFISNFCSFSFPDFSRQQEWSDFKKLKDLRNEVIHSMSPFLGISLREIAQNLNLSILGVGSLLNQLQEGQGRLNLSFIERIRTSPVIHYNQVTIKTEGKFEEKTFFNKISR